MCEIYKSSVSLSMSFSYKKYQLVWYPLKGWFPRLGICNIMPRIPELLPRIAQVSAWAQLEIGCNAETNEVSSEASDTRSREHHGDHTRRPKCPVNEFEVGLQRQPFFNYTRIVNVWEEGCWSGLPKLDKTVSQISLLHFSKCGYIEDRLRTVLYSWYRTSHCV